MKVMENRCPVQWLLVAHHLLYGEGGLILAPRPFSIFSPNQARLLWLILQGIKLKQFFQAGKCAFCRPANHFHRVIVLPCSYNVHYEPFGSQYFLFEKISTYSFSGFCKYNIINTLTCINCEYPV